MPVVGIAFAMFGQVGPHRTLPLESTFIDFEDVIGPVKKLFGARNEGSKVLMSSNLPPN